VEETERMMANARLVAISKVLSLILRHKPEQFGLVLDPEGYAPIEDVLAAVRSRVPDVTEGDLVSVVETIEPDKRRFTLSEGEIRANYGHSLRERILHEAQVPPAVLWHGTTDKTVSSILANGIRPMRRQYVHLTTDVDLAARVGARRGMACVLKVEALRAHAEGVRFYRANESFWLADLVPARFVTSI
jgi:putative RNA 2'-phosphotransferase